MLDVDSPNLYAFVGWQPNSRTDPLGLQGREGCSTLPEAAAEACRATVRGQVHYAEEATKRSIDFAYLEALQVANNVNSIPQLIWNSPQLAEKLLNAPGQAAMFILDCPGRLQRCYEGAKDFLATRWDEARHYFDRPAEDHAADWGDALTFALFMYGGQAEGWSVRLGRLTPEAPSPTVQEGALQASRQELISTLRAVQGQKVRETAFFGQNLKQLRSRGIQQFDTPGGSERLKLQVFQSELPGGETAAQRFFTAATGRVPEVGVPVSVEGRLFVLRSSSQNLPTVEVVSPTAGTVEKIRFLRGSL